MSLFVRSTSGWARFAQANPPSPETAGVWLVRLRWFAVAGMLATAICASLLVPELSSAPVLVAVGGVAAMNVVWTLVLRGRQIAAGVEAQIVLDVCALAVVLWLSGGVTNPFAPFLTFQVVLAGLLCRGRTTVIVAGVTLLGLALLTLAPPLPALSGWVLRLGQAVSLVSLAAFMGFFVLVHTHRAAELVAESARNEKLAVLGRLVGGMSHELATPLATILIASKDLVEVGRELGSAEASQLARAVASEAARASAVIALLRGQVSPDQRQAVEITGFVREFAERELDRLGFKGERVFEAPAPITAVVPTAGLCQVLTNVLANAVEATADTPAPRIVLSVKERPHARVEVRLRDNGPGLAPSLLERIGEPFQTTKVRGMGLGLYLSTILTERMHGDLHLENVAPEGAQVTLVLGTEGA